MPDGIASCLPFRFVICGLVQTNCQIQLLLKTWCLLVTPRLHLLWFLRCSFTFWVDPLWQTNCPRSSCCHCLPSPATATQTTEYYYCFRLMLAGNDELIQKSLPLHLVHPLDVFLTDVLPLSVTRWKIGEPKGKSFRVRIIFFVINLVSLSLSKFVPPKTTTPTQAPGRNQRKCP